METERETMKGSALIGQRVTLECHRPPCRVVLAGTEPLVFTTEGVIRRIESQPGGPIGVLEADDGRMIAFDCGLDISAGVLSIVLPPAAPGADRE